MCISSLYQSLFLVQGSVEESNTPDRQAVIGPPSLAANISERGISEECEEHKVRMTWFQ